jgi:hypothetical protein
MCHVCVTAPSMRGSVASLRKGGNDIELSGSVLNVSLRPPPDMLIFQFQMCAISWS